MLLIFCALGASSRAQVTIIQSTMAGERWANKGEANWGPPSGSESHMLTVDRTSLSQQIFGFGGALTDTSAINYQLMNATSRARFLAAYWGRVGAASTSLGYTVHRVCINSPDYANATFNYDNVTDDFDLNDFDSNLTYDRQHVLPLIRDVRATVASAGGTAHFFASPWSPPGWMKRNGNMISSSMPCLKADSAGGSYGKTWAAYIVKWLQAFEAAGVKFWGLTTQNEMFANQSSFESCTFTAEDMRDWLRDHLGPALRAAYPTMAIMVYDHNKVAAPAVVATILADPAAAAFVDGTAVHWYDYMGDTVGFSELVNTSTLGGPGRFVLATEACYIQNLTETWSSAEMYALDILADLNAGAVGWVRRSMPADSHESALGPRRGRIVAMRRWNGTSSCTTARRCLEEG
jgi:glucosylceramidase